MPAKNVIYLYYILTYGVKHFAFASVIFTPLAAPEAPIKVCTEHVTSFGNSIGKLVRNFLFTYVQQVGVP